MKIGIVGTRGIPAKYGGFETFAEEVSSLLASSGFIVTVYCDRPESNKNSSVIGNVKLRHLSTTKSDNPLLYYYLSIYYGLKENDVVIVAGTGGSFFYFLNQLFRKILITNTDGLESRRAKWSFIKKRLIQLSEILAIKFSDHLIADSKGISQYLLHNYPILNKDKLSTIEYGAPINITLNHKYLEELKLKKDNYFLVVSRLEPENNLRMIIEGYKITNDSKPLIIVGNLINNSYVNSLLKNQSDRIRFIGGIYNKDEIASLRTGAFAYMHGHSVGGTNPSLLEALGSSNICICHDNIFNREVTNNNQLYFSNPDELKSRIEEMRNYSNEQIFKLKNDARLRITSYYNWENIATKYKELLDKYETTCS